MDRRLWTPEEDHQIKRIVSKLGTKKWPLISELLCTETEFERTGKQCRQRWYNHLSPEISSAYWSQKDENLLFELHKQHGNKWKIISRLFEGRTDNSIKNHFYSTIRRCLRRINKLQGEKNSTLKMRTIKPYVLSKILADRGLTEAILELGKNKPSKARRDYKAECFQQFNQMIEKLYSINSVYETDKLSRKTRLKQLFTGKSHSEKEEGQEEEEEKEEQEEEEEEEEEGGQGPSDGSQWSSSKGERRNGLNLMLMQLQEESCNGIMEPILPVKSRARGEVLKGSSRIGRGKMGCQLQEFKWMKLNEAFSRKGRKTINYMKLNEGILCQHESQEMRETCPRRLIPRKGDCVKSWEPIAFQDTIRGKLEDIIEIMEVEDKQQEKSTGLLVDHRSVVLDERFSPRHLLSHEEFELRCSRHFEIANPSPSYNKSHSFFDDLVVIGTHFKMLTPKQEGQGVEEYERKQSEDNFIEQILQINFDPEFALHYGDGEEEGGQFPEPQE